MNLKLLRQYIFRITKVKLFEKAVSKGNFKSNYEKFAILAPASLPQKSFLGIVWLIGIAFGMVIGFGIGMIRDKLGNS